MASTSKRRRKTSKKSQTIGNAYIRLIIGVALLASALYFVFIIHRGAAVHSSQITNELGFVGALLYNTIRTLAGQCEYLIPLLFALIGLRFCAPKLGINNRIVITSAVIVVCLLAFRHLGIDPSVAMEKGLEGIGGGVIGAAISLILVSAISKIGAIIALVAIIIIALFICTNGALIDWIVLGLSHIHPIFARMGTSVKNFFTKSQSTLKDEGVSIKTKVKKAKPEKALPVNSEKTTKKRAGTKKALQESTLEVHDELVPEREEGTFIAKLEKMNTEIVKEDETNKVEQYMTSGEKDRSDKSIMLRGDEYILPGDELLDEVEKKVQTNKKEIEENAQLLKDTLSDFGVKGEINNVNVGPTITQYEFKPAAGVRVTKIVNLADDLALSLAASDIRIEAPIPNKSAVGIEVPNTRPRTVKFKEVIASDAFKNAESKLSFALGKDISGHPMVADLAKMPHLLIAGATGSGKSVCLNALITSILFKAKPNEVKFILVDPKKVELSNYSNIPHLLAPVVTDVKKAAATLKWVVKEMERRYDVFAESGSRDLATYNQKFIKAEALSNNEHDYEFLPQIVVIIDELADLMMVAPADVEDSICRLAQLARAAGIHLVIATQRPSVDIITGLIKANIPSRIAFAVSSQIDSRTILDMGGAEKLLGNGDMLYFPRGYAKPVRIQGVYVTDDEIEDVISYVKRQAAPVYDRAMNEGVEALMSGDILTDFGDERPEHDKLLGDACRFFIENGNASISMLQRHFRIGYTRAARIIDELENLGFVGPYEGSKARKINIGLDECEAYFNEDEGKE
ncbi:MAG: DNA translocase FtsK [Peptococcaceae bacterium]|nr:DNA translocase FtsK [Peptococcaceae bacterium]